MERERRLGVVIWALLGLFVLTLADWQFGGLRLDLPGENPPIGLIAVGLPAICVVLLGFQPRSRARAWALAGLIPVAFLCSTFGFLVALGQLLPDWTRQDSIPVGRSQIVTYFTDAGAWDNGEVVVQQEIRLVPGLLWVKPLSSKDYPCRLRVSVLERHHVRCEYTSVESHGANARPEAQRDDAWVF